MQLDDECGSVGEVHVERALREPGLLGDLADAQAVEAVASLIKAAKDKPDSGGSNDA